ncbi:hypothetical protein Celaphus_00005865 [Cervus elaphus hippelaphus]|uniref:Uncharacterized protein n=1 Tax=Cervus elaphus hippelaphus TaxID=46360 RepID=A0A212CX26_CEREH|nr:hypothetical protein Celaphus_00005865 [Cervus elaphus hippelaphus]
MEPKRRGSLSEDSDLPQAGNPKENGLTTVLLTPASQNFASWHDFSICLVRDVHKLFCVVIGLLGSMIRDMAEAVTQWEQLNPPQGGEPEKPRNLVLLGL